MSDRVIGRDSPKVCECSHYLLNHNREGCMTKCPCLVSVRRDDDPELTAYSEGRKFERAAIIKNLTDLVNQADWFEISKAWVNRYIDTLREAN